MSKALIKILEELAEPASYFGIDEGELASLVVVAKFNTELSNEILQNSIKALLLCMQKQETLDIFKEVGIIDIDGKDFYELLDMLADAYYQLSEENKTKIIDALGGVFVLRIVLKIFGKINKTNE